MIDKRNPRIALILGDPCGIGPELVAKLMADRDTTEKADVAIIGDQNVFDEAVKIADVRVEYKPADDVSPEMFSSDAPILLSNPIFPLEGFQRGQVSKGSGAYQLDCLAKIGQINLKTVTNLTGLRGIPFAALDLRGTPVSDVQPLRGMPLIMLGLEGTGVLDLGPLRDAPLKKLYLNNTEITDLKALKGLPIEELMLVDTGVSDLSPLRGMPLKMLWLNWWAGTSLKPAMNSMTSWAWGRSWKGRAK